MDTIRLENNSEKNKKKNEISKKEIDKFKIKNCLDILDDSTEEKKNNPKLYKEKKPKKQSEIQNKINILSNQQNRRKSISISINQLTNKYRNQIKINRREGRSHSTMNYNRTYDLANIKYKYKEIYNKLPTKKITSKKMLKINDTNEEKNKKKKTSFSSINSLNQEKTNKNHNLDIEEINEPLTEKQKSTLKQILIQEELIVDEMDDNTINLIINSTSYIRVKSKVIIFSKESPPGDYYYMIEKGQLTYSIDGDIYELPQFSGIGTSALIKNRKKIAFQLPLKNVIYLNYLLKNIKKLQKLFIKIYII